MYIEFIFDIREVVYSLRLGIIPQEYADRIKCLPAPEHVKVFVDLVTGETYQYIPSGKACNYSCEILITQSGITYKSFVSHSMQFEKQNFSHWIINTQDVSQDEFITHRLKRTVPSIIESQSLVAKPTK